MAQRSITSFFSGAAVPVSRKRLLAEVAEPGDEIDDLADSRLMHTPCETRAVEMEVSESPAPDIGHIVNMIRLLLSSCTYELYCKLSSTRQGM